MRHPLQLLAFAALLILTACSSGGATTTVEVGPEAVILDVRSPGEHASGHLEGATLLDFNAGDLAAALPELDQGAEYVVYCRSGNRSRQAVTLMEEAGFTNVTDLGSLESASKRTGIDIVK